MLTLIPVLLALGSAAFAQRDPGPALFEKNCVVCHKAGSENRAPLPEVMKSLTQAAIVTALESGTMKAQGAALTPVERVALAKFLSGTEPATAVIGNPCGTGAPAGGSGAWNGWGVDAANTRFQPPKMAGLSAADVPKLKLKWAFGFPGAATAFGQPTIAGGKMYFGSDNGTVYAVNAKSGCVYWTFKAPATVRSAITLASVGGAQHAFFGDIQANVYAVNAADGRLRWRMKVDDHRYARVTGSPKFEGGKVYVSVSSVEEVSPASAKYECCTFRGSVAALEASTGKLDWKSHAIPDPPTATKKNPAGTQLYGPAGAAIWMSPTLDLERKMIYVGTGNGYSDPPTKYTDAITAYGMDGSMKWVKQMTAGDGWNFACINPNKANCPEVNGPDVDFGASPILKRLKNGRRLLIAGQKSGVVHAIDPDRDGEIVWQVRIGKGGALGGIQWGMAADDDNVYVALSDRNPSKHEEEGGMFALKLATGEKVWHTPAPPPTSCEGRPNCSAAQMAPVTAIAGVVFSGSMDGTLRAYSAKDGSIVWSFNTIRDFETVNGVKAKGGSISASGPVIVDGMLYLNSGYGALGGIPGNVLLAFGLE